MKIAIIGASGRAGSEILKELAARGHSLTAIARHPERIAPLPGVTARQGDVRDQAGLAALLAGHEVVISAVMFLDSDVEVLLGAVRQAGVPRYLVVGGAGSLEVAPGLKLLDAPGFPEAYRAEASAGAAFLTRLRQETALDWTFLSPSADFFVGPRTAKFRLGGDQLLTGPEGSRISFADYAIAMADEVERPAHSRRRFTVGY
ncbi:NAD(P)-dependent oxidoreductase [Falsiroseomonas tokyonensis]|uniref:NAD(P)-dependent oxidoreductase n=1 Tax=Falsiroseomonas tokyonensis TaxID=430521 RepID=A0ABV7BTV7_9PROT|nr:NAD(P)-dependent oxidoreductase [Falsiroseomonas tokyonensis]